jgi:hypothetical protein
VRDPPRQRAGRHPPRLQQDGLAEGGEGGQSDESCRNRAARRSRAIRADMGDDFSHGHRSGRRCTTTGIMAVRRRYHYAARFDTTAREGRSDNTGCKRSPQGAEPTVFARRGGVFGTTGGGTFGGGLRIGGRRSDRARKEKP